MRIMPFSSKRQQKRKLANAMNRKRKEHVPLSDNLITAATDQFLPVTPDKIQPLKRELHVLNSGTREQSYVHKDSGNRIIHWDSLKSLIQKNWCVESVDQILY